MENKIKHLEMIQGVINRIADHKPQFKGWFITLIVAINILDTSKFVENQVILMMIISVSFLCISSYYLYLERLYIELFNNVRKTEKTDFSMDISGFRKTSEYFFCLLSISNFIYYVAIVTCIYFLFPKPHSLCATLLAIVLIISIYLLVKDKKGQ
ncbi:hypothetical protein K2V74_12815 [Mammaliicoccus sciuri]|uniref:hypothetical protein n=1 Tax=Mammaliicoccus sciuri TaxID=1296 RepID=UPI001E56CE91|nr:hypothetical protein [Mammaliicoccus sciuri]MCD8875202.1 hypothetical protein [Mammaliicoccus sciuri]